MRCLYCGKELALLKRWTSGGEFCSDTHRQQYQEEYNQLALNRLLQAKPAGPKASAPEPVESKAPEPVAVVERKVEIAAVAPTEHEAEREPEPVLVAAAPADTQTPSASAPPEPGFLLELPLPLMANIKPAIISETEPVQSATPTLPSRDFEGWETQLVAAGQVVLEPSIRFVDWAAHPSEDRLEVRDFARSVPSVQIDLRAAGEAGLLETFEEPMELLIFPHPPPGSPPMWQEPAKEFGSVAAELGDLARVAFQTTGFETENGARVASAIRIEPEVVVQLEPPPAPKPAPPEPVNQTAGPVELPPTPDRGITRFISVRSPLPVPRRDVARELAREREVVVRVTTPFLRQPMVSKPAQAPPPTPAQKVPDLVTKPLPLTLHGLAAGRGKPVQVFPSVVSSGIAVQIPRSSALPLRPVMTLEAAPPPPAEAPKTDIKKPQPARQDPRFATGKTRRPDARILGLDREPEKPEKIDKPIEKAIDRAIEKKDPEPKVAPTTDPPKLTKLPAPLAAPYTAATDLGLPSLSMEASGGFWRKLPAAGKAGIAALVVLAVAGAIGFAMKGNGTAASTAPRIVEAEPLPTGESGWITDWGADPGVRRQRQISILRPSLILTDYRMEFQAQIETKAVGWVFRAMDTKNFYVEKLEIVKPGLEPGVALVRFAVINGEEQPRTQFPLTLPLRLDTLYKIRFQAVGDHFTTWVQDQKIDEWTDGRIKTGGVGLYNERGERASLKGGVNVVPLMLKK